MAPPNHVNQLVIVTIDGSQANEITERLVQDGFYVTQIDSRGGLLHEASISLLIGLERTRGPRLLEHLRECCQTRRQFLPIQTEGMFPAIQPVIIEAEVGGATLYVLGVERFEQV